MKLARLGVIALIVAFGCTEPRSSPTGVSSDIAGQAIVGAPDDYVATPAGWAHRSCVHEIPDGAQLDTNRVVTRRDGTRFRIPECLHPMDMSTRSRGRDGARAPSDWNPNWKETAYARRVLPARYRKITANWSVPANPTGSYPPGQTRVYYTFPGLEQYYIIQPVLQYGYNGWFGGQYWAIASWRVHNSDVYFSTPRTVTVGSELYGSVEASDCAGGMCTWTVSTAVPATGVSTTWSLSGTDDYTWAYGGAVEVANFTACDQYPRNGVFYSQVALYDENMTRVYPSWIRFVNPNGSPPACAFAVTNDPGSEYVQLFHNPAPAPAVTNVTTDPTPPRQYLQFSLTVNGSGFDPATAEIVYSQHCWPGPWCSQVYANSQLSVKTQNQLVAPYMAFSIADTVRIQVRNGLGGFLSSPPKTIVIVPLY